VCYLLLSLSRSKRCYELLYTESIDLPHCYSFLLYNMFWTRSKPQAVTSKKKGHPFPSKQLFVLGMPVPPWNPQLKLTHRLTSTMPSLRTHQFQLPLCLRLLHGCVIQNYNRRSTNCCIHWSHYISVYLCRILEWCQLGEAQRCGKVSTTRKV